MNNKNIDLEFAEAIRLLPEAPSVEVLRFLSSAAYAVPSGVKEKGKVLQQKHGIDVIPPVSEIEWAAGLWSVIRDALIKEGQKPYA